MLYLFCLMTLSTLTTYSMNYTLTDMFYVPRKIAQYQPEDSQTASALCALPPEPLNAHLMPNMSVKDQYNLTSTCQRLHRTLCIYAPSIAPDPRLDYDECVTKITAEVIANIIAGIGFCTFSYMINHSDNHDAGPIGNLIFNYPSLFCVGLRTLWNTLDISHDCRYTRFKSLKLRTITPEEYFATLYQSFATLMKQNHLATDDLYIRFYSKSQVAPLITAAKESGVPKVTISDHRSRWITPSTIYRIFINPSYLTISPLLSNNRNLKELTIEDSFNIDDFCKGLDQNNHLEAFNCNIQLTQDSVEELLQCASITHLTIDSSTNHRLSLKKADREYETKLIQALISKPNITRLRFTYNPLKPIETPLDELANNTTLEHLALIGCLSGAVVPSVLAFMKKNTKLKSLNLKKNFSPESKKKLTESDFKPATLEV